MDTAEIPAAALAPEPSTPAAALAPEPSTPAAARPRRFLRVFRAKERTGQAIVEFALVSMAFFMVTMGTVDLGRAIYQYHTLTNAVREGARLGKMEPTNGAGIRDKVIEKSPTLGLTYADITEKCDGGCYQGCSWVEVEATVKFTSILEEFLDIPKIDLTSKARVEAE